MYKSCDYIQHRARIFTTAKLINFYQINKFFANFFEKIIIKFIISVKMAY